MQNSFEDNRFEDMARSEFESAMAFGVSLDNFTRLARSVCSAVSAAEQCCGKCEKPEAEVINWHDRYMRDVEGLNNEGDPIGGEPAMGLRQVVERQQAAINELVQRLQTADLVIQTLLFKAGGEVVVSAADCDSILGHMVVNDTAEDKSSFTFRLVKASTVEVAQVQ